VKHSGEVRKFKSGEEFEGEGEVERWRRGKMEKESCDVKSFFNTVRRRQCIEVGSAYIYFSDALLWIECL
jgi:hypothetical protein